jgi:hypothetical protein
MPAEDGKLLPDEITKLTAWLEEKWTNQTCTSCGTDQWNVTDQLALMPIHRPDKSFIGAPAVPSVVAVCLNCGHTILFNAVKIGLLEGTRPLEEPNQANAKPKKKGAK